METSHDVLAFVGLLDTLGTVGTLAVVVWLFYSGRIVAASVIDDCCHEATQEALRVLESSGKIPPSPKTARSRNKQGGSENKGFGGAE